MPQNRPRNSLWNCSKSELGTGLRCRLVFTLGGCSEGLLRPSLPSSITPVTFLIVCRLHRFFSGLRANCGHVPRLPGPHRLPLSSERPVARGCFPSHDSERSGGHFWPDEIGTGFGVLLSLCRIARAWRLREDVRNTEVCFALVGNLLRQASR